MPPPLPEEDSEPAPMPAPELKEQGDGKGAKEREKLPRSCGLKEREKLPRMSCQLRLKKEMPRLRAKSARRTQRWRRRRVRRATWRWPRPAEEGGQGGRVASLQAEPNEPKPKPEFGEFGAGEFGAGAGGVLALVAAEVEARGRKGARLGGQSGEGARR